MFLFRRGCLGCFSGERADDKFGKPACAEPLTAAAWKPAPAWSRATAGKVKVSCSGLGFGIGGLGFRI